MKRTTALLTVTTLLLAACKPTPTPTDPGATTPTAPVTGKSLDLQMALRLSRLRSR